MSIIGGKVERERGREKEKRGEKMMGGMGGRFLE